MLDMIDIEKTITELENGKTTFANCNNLASLYIVREYFKNAPKATKAKENDKYEIEVIKEYSDILPQYQHYCDTKRKYQLNETTAQAVLNCMNNVCTEIKEFIATLYTSTEMEDERKKLNNVIKWLYDEYVKE